MDTSTTTNHFERGDLALHRNNQLDARPVESVEGDSIRLRIGTLVTDPVPAANYERIPGRCPATGRSASACEHVDHHTCALNGEQSGTKSYLVTFPAEHHTPDVVIEAEAYSQEFAEQLAQHLHISEYTISLDTDSGWMTNRRTRANRHFKYAEAVSA